MVWLVVLLPLALLLGGFPVFLLLLVTTVVALLAFTTVPLTQVHVALYGAIDKFPLLAVPFFLFAGEMMARGSMARRIVDLMLAMIGSVRGGLALSVVGTSTVFGALSGSSVATIGAVGRLLYPRMKKAGYDDRFSLGLITSAGSIDIMIPPSISMILYSIAAGQSITQMFMAGIGPGLVMAGVMAVYIVIVARGFTFVDTEPFEAGRLLRALRASGWALGAPVIILGGIYAGIVSPTEAAGIACVYAILVSMILYREISLRELWQISVSTVYLTAQVMIIVAAAAVFSWLLTISGAPQALGSAIQELKAAPWAILAVINVVLLIVGCFIDPTSAILVLTPLLLPVALAAGVDPIHFGIIMTLNLAIGMFTPPFGLNIFMTQALFKAPVDIIYRGLVPFIAINLVTLALVTYIPELSLYLMRRLS
jgi:C4-dicarboxylate transporter DctM subunit